MCDSSCRKAITLSAVLRASVLDGQELLEVNPSLEKNLRELNLYSEKLMLKIARTGNLQDVDLPENIKKLYATSQEIDYKWHVLMQAAFQNYCDSGVSKTINLPNSATREDIAMAYRLARDLHCKGITVYRDGCKSQQVLYSGTERKNNTTEEKQKVSQDLILSAPENLLKVDSTFDPACTSGSCNL